MDFNQSNHHQKNNSRFKRINFKKLALPIGVLVFALLTAGVFTKNPQLLRNGPFFRSTPQAGLTPTPSPSPLSPLKEPAFDVPALVGKNIDEIQKGIGPSIDKEPGTLPKGVETWRLIFRKGKAELVVTYDIKTGKTTTFSLATDDPTGKTNDKARLLKLGTLQENSNSYDVVFVKTAENYDYFTAIKVLPK